MEEVKSVDEQIRRETEAVQLKFLKTILRDLFRSLLNVSQNYIVARQAKKKVRSRKSHLKKMLHVFGNQDINSEHFWKAGSGKTRQNKKAIMRPLCNFLIESYLNVALVL